TNKIISNLTRIFFGLGRNSEHWGLPKTLAELDLARLQLEFPSTGREILVCPGTGSKPGAINDVEEWTDYIYIGSTPVYFERAAMLISPPENHNGKSGYVLFCNGAISKLPPDEVREFIRHPLRNAPDVQNPELEATRSLVSVRIPKRLQPYYPTK